MARTELGVVVLLLVRPAYPIRPLYVIQELQAAWIYCLSWVAVVLPASPEGIIYIAKDNAVLRGIVCVIFYVIQDLFSEPTVHPLKN